MTPTLLTVILAALAGVTIYAARRRRNRVFGHDSASSRPDLGVVSSRWLAEIRRDEPWIGR
jgi:hypothetical protein